MTSATAGFVLWTALSGTADRGADRRGGPGFGRAPAQRDNRHNDSNHRDERHGSHHEHRNADRTPRGQGFLECLRRVSQSLLKLRSVDDVELFGEHDPLAAFNPLDGFLRVLQVGAEAESVDLDRLNLVAAPEDLADLSQEPELVDGWRLASLDVPVH